MKMTVEMQANTPNELREIIVAYLNDRVAWFRRCEETSDKKSKLMYHYAAVSYGNVAEELKAAVITKKAPRS